MKQLRILIADDHPIVREGLKKIIERDAQLQVVGEAENGEEAVARITELRPDVAVIDLDMPIKDGFAVARAVREARLDVKLILLTMHNSEAIFRAAFDEGVSGYVLKDGAITEIVGAIRAVAAGRNFISPRTVEHHRAHICEKLDLRGFNALVKSMPKLTSTRRITKTSIWSSGSWCGRKKRTARSRRRSPTTA